MDPGSFVVHKRLHLPDRAGFRPFGEGRQEVAVEFFRSLAGSTFTPMGQHVRNDAVGFYVLLQDLAPPLFPVHADIGEYSQALRVHVMHQTAHEISTVYGGIPLAIGEFMNVIKAGEDIPLICCLPATTPEDFYKKCWAGVQQIGARGCHGRDPVTD